MVNKMDLIAIVGWRLKRKKINYHNPSLWFATKARA
jgi:hypothetical protein